jgi:tetratricopeptide (TPR) repeat protein
LADCGRVTPPQHKILPRAVQEGNAFAAKGEWENAIAAYNKAIQDDRGCGLAYSNRGAAYCALGHYDQGIADCTDAIRLGERAALRKRGLCYYKKGALDKAMRDLDGAIRFDRKDVVAYTYRGMVSAGLGDYDKSISDYDVAIRLDGTFALAYNNRGSAWCLRKNNLNKFYFRGESV